jgi:hypothetical protein
VPDNLITYGPNPSVTGKTLYARSANGAAQWFNSSTNADENYTVGNYAHYVIALTEQGSSGFFVGTTPASLPIGPRDVVIQVEAVVNTPAPSDAAPGGGSCGFHAYWDGTQWIVPDAPVSSRLATSGYTPPPTPPTVLAIAAGVLDVAQSAHNGAGTIGAFIGAATDPWGGVITANQAGTLFRAWAAAALGERVENADGSQVSYADALDVTTTRLTATMNPRPAPGAGTAVTRTATIH